MKLGTIVHCSEVNVVLRGCHNIRVKDIFKMLISENTKQFRTEAKAVSIFLNLQKHYFLITENNVTMTVFFVVYFFIFSKSTVREVETLKYRSGLALVLQNLFLLVQLRFSFEAS